MFRFDPQLKVYVYAQAVDFRKSINGLAALVEQGLKLDPFAAAVYVFCNKSRKRIKLLWWQRNGFWLLMKRLESERFAWPHRGAEVMVLSVEELHWLLDGVDLDALKGHRSLRIERVA